jgi:hypothetical protein
MLKSRTLVTVVLVLCAAGAAAQESGRPPLPPARKIPGIVAADPFPNACTDCHIHYADMKLDTRFGTLMARWSEQVEPGLLKKAQAAAPKGLVLKGRHPAVQGVLTDIPGKCLSCHGKSSTVAPPFSSMLHAIHLTGGEENHFLTLFQGECTYCHKLDPSTGRWRVPSAAEKRS